MAALSTVVGLTSYARTLLQDTLAPYRYSTPDLLVELNAGLLEMRRLRPDLFISTPDVTPTYATADTTTIAVDQQYLLALAYWMAGQAQLRDEEETTDARASAMLQKFTSVLIGETANSRSVGERLVS